jgi:predicted ATPase
MSEKLIVRNFGPIKSAEVDLKRFTVFIGPNGSGKSTLAKLVSIFRDSKFHTKPNSFTEFLTDYGLKGYLQKNTFIQYKSQVFDFKFKDLEVNFNINPLFVKWEALLNWDLNLDTLKINVVQMPSHITNAFNLVNEILNSNDKILENLDVTDIVEKCKIISKHKRISGHSIYGLIDDLVPLVGRHIGRFESSIFIPEFRILYSYLEEHLVKFLNARIPFPFLLSQFVDNLVGFKMESIVGNLPVFDVKYSIENNVILIEEEINKFALSDASSGLKSFFPIWSAIYNSKQKVDKIDNSSKKLSFTIEEPELNLFPTYQKKLIELLAEQANNKDYDTYFVLPTHSPYILTTLNSLMKAYKVYEEFGEEREKLDQIISEKYAINPAEVSAYSVREGTAISIIDKEFGFIEEGGIDEVSDDLNDTFNKLLFFEEELK